MKLLENLRFVFEFPLWIKFPELAVYDTILEKRIDIIKLFESDISKDLKNNNLGRKDSPSVEQIVRAIIYKEVRGLTYEELEIHQFDSEICKRFLKLGKKAYSDSLYQSYTKKIKPETIKKMFIEINKIGIDMGYEDVKDVRTDSTVVQSNIHYPTNNSLVFDCIKTGTDLLTKLAQRNTESYNMLINRLLEVKSNYYDLNNIKINEADKEVKKQKRAELMKKLFTENLTFLQSIATEIKQVILTDVSKLPPKDKTRIVELDKQIDKIYKNAYKFQIEGKKIKNEDKIFSIYQEHTDLIVKGLRECLFGHKVNISSGKSNLILDCNVLKGNPSDVNLYLDPLKNIHANYNRQIESSATDGGYASFKNLEYATNELHIKNVVFTKIVGSLKSVVESELKEKILKNFRAGAEAVISNLKRGFDLVTVDWKGYEMFESKVLWSVVGYNIRVLTGHIMNTLFPKPEKA
jgi:IS5 family transposase